MQMPHSVSEKSTVISTNAVEKQTRGAQDCFGFRDFAADVDTTVGGRREERGKEDGAEKWKGREGRGEEMNQDPTFQMRTVIKLIA